MKATPWDFSTFVLLQNIKQIEGRTLWGNLKIFEKSHAKPKRGSVSAEKKPKRGIVSAEKSEPSALFVEIRNIRIFVEKN